MRDDGDRPGRALMNSGKPVGEPRTLPGWSEPKWLAEWISDPHDMPPASLDDINTEIGRVVEWLQPAPRPPSDYLGPLALMFGLPGEWPRLAPLYDEALGDLPDWALQDSVRSCLRHCRFFPKPGEILERVPELLTQMRIAKARLDTAVWRLELGDRRRRG